MAALGAKFRAVRVKRGWRQIDVAARADVHRAVVSRIERGRLDHLTLGAMLAVARVLEIQVTIRARSHGADLDRLVAGNHSALHESVAGWFGRERSEWILVPEVSFSIYGERGVIDILAWHPGRRALIVIELKTDVVDVNELIGSMDQRRRLARQIAVKRGWDPLTVSCWVIVADGRTNRERLARHRTMLRGAFPVDGRTVRSWLRDPVGAISGLSMWRTGGTDAGRQNGLAARHRVRAKARRARTPVAAG